MQDKDLSFKDKKYFIDGATYNCPFCNRKNVKFAITSIESFSWSSNRLVFLFIVQCSENECEKRSFHLSNFHLATYIPYLKNYRIFRYPTEISGEDSRDLSNKKDIDAQFFFHQPTSFFTVDPRIPHEIREPLSECENCRKSSFLTGASACLRKSIYKLLKLQKIPEKNGDLFIPYEERIDKLRDQFPKIERDYFSDLKIVHGLTSQELHENDWGDFDSKTLLFLQEVTQQVLYEIYVLPDESKQRKSIIDELKERASGPKKDNSSDEPGET